MSIDAGIGFTSGQFADHLSAIIESSDDAILSKDRDAIVTSWNPAAERMYGYSASEAIGSPISIVIPEHRAGEERMILSRVLTGERVDHYETDRITKDGRLLRVSLTVSPIKDADGTILGASVIARDITRRHRALMLAARLQEVTSALAQETSPDGVVDVVLNEVVSALGAEAGAIGLVDGDEIVLAGSVGYSSAGMANWERFPMAADVPMGDAVRRAEGVWLTSAGEIRSRYSGLAATALRSGALAVLPLGVGDMPFGALALSFGEERGFDPEERAFLVAATQQAAYALNRARLYEEERMHAERQRFLAEAGALLTRSLDVDETLQELAGLAVRHVADWCAIDLVDEESGFRPVAIAHHYPERVRLALTLRERYPMDPDADVGVPKVLRTGIPEFHAEVDDAMLAEAARDDEHLRLLRELGLRSAMIVPLRARGAVLGTISLVASERQFDESDLALAEDLARRAGLAIDNAMLFRREHEAAVTLQRALLPDSVPTAHDGLEFDVRYRPAAPGLEVGGDWYEVVPAEDGTVTLTIGDVAGRGIRAAAVMGRVRLALRAYVLDGHPPKEAISRLDRLMRGSDHAQMTTLFHLQFAPQTGTARYVRAGHPPALLRLPGGEVVELAGEGTPPLGVFDDLEVMEHEAEIPPGSLLLVYTDGLIERRDQDLMESLGRLKESFAAAPASPRECLDWLEAQLGAASIPDDVAMLAMASAPQSK